MGKLLNHSQLAEKLRKAGENGFNVLLEGPAGTGKTSLVQLVAGELNLRMKYYSASTLDPFVDLVGLPVPTTRVDGTRVLEFHRQEDIAQAEIIFFDELNRAHAKVLNAVFEMIQFRSINGERLPKLRCVFAAINPPDDDYQVTELDPALVDRFHVHLRFSNAPDRPWFAEKYGDLGKALCDWWSVDLSVEQARLISPRKLEHIALLSQSDCDVEDAIPDKELKLPFHLLQQRIESPESVIDIKDIVRDPSAFGNLVAADQSMALRFLQLVPALKPRQISDVRTVFLSLSPEFIAQINSQPAQMKRIYESIGKYAGASERVAFREMLDDIIKPFNANLDG